MVGIYIFGVLLVKSGWLEGGGGGENNFFFLGGGSRSKTFFLVIWYLLLKIENVSESKCFIRKQELLSSL